MKIKRLSEDTLIARLLARTAHAVFRHRRSFLYPQLVLFALCILYTVRGLPELGIKGLQFDMSRDNLVGENKKYHQNFLRFKKEFPTQDDLVVVVESDDPSRNRQFVDRLGPKLEAEPDLFRNIFYRGDLKMMGSKALMCATEEDLNGLKEALTNLSPFIDEFTRTTNLVSLFTMINRQFRTAKPEQNAQTDALLKSLPALERIIKEATGSLGRSGTPPSPGVAALFSPDEEAQQDIYITYAEGQVYLVSAQAPNSDLNGPAIKRLRELVRDTQTEVPGLNVGITGESVLELDEMTQSERDTTLASIVALLACALIFIYGYQETGRPVKATLCLIVGLGYTMAFATLAVGHLNILTITFVPILIGLAIDYGVHLISRFEEELRRGRMEEEAMTKAIVFTGQGIFTGAFTTAGAFFAMAFTNFRGIQEMGIICGGGLVVCLIPMMTLLPVLLLKGRQNVIDQQRGDPMARRARIENLWLRRPALVAGVTFVLSALAASQISRVYFDYNLLKMQSAGLPSVEFEKRLLASAGKSLLSAAVVATNLEQAALLEQQISNLSTVAKIESATRFLQAQQTNKMAMIGQIKASLAGIHFAEPDPCPVNLPELSQTLWSLSGYCGLAYDEAKADEPAIAKQLMALHDDITDLRRAMLAGNESQLTSHSNKLGVFQRALFRDVIDTFVTLQNQDNSAPLTAQDLPEAIRNRFIGVTGKYLLMVFPKKDVWQRENQKEFIDQLQQYAPQATGTPVQLYYYTELLRRSYEEAARYSLAAIVLLVLLHFRSALCLALALVPVGVGFIWLGGLMGYFDVQLNPANIMTLPLVIGIGVTNGIHILNRYAEEQTPGILARSTGKAVLVSGLTAIAGFGSLILAKHQGIKSLGYVMSVGLATCMIAGLTFLPALLSLLTRPAKEVKKRPSADNARSTLGREEPRS
jgi:uncharacterized protein